MISRTIVLSISGEVFVEYDVLLPMTSIFDVPMTADDLQEIERREPAGCDVEAFLVSCFAVERALADHPRDGGEALEAVSGRDAGCGEDEDRAPLLPAMTRLGGLRGSGVGGGGFEQGCDACEQFALVELERDDIVATPLLDGLDHATIAMNGISRDDAAFERHAFEQPDRGFGLAARPGLRLGKGHAHGHAPHRDHHGGHMSTALFVGALEAFTVDRQDGSAGGGPQRPPESLHEAGKRALQGDRVEPTQHPAECVVAGDAVLEFEDGAKKSFLLTTEFRHLDAGLSPAKHGGECDEQHVAQVMPRINVARIRYRFEDDREIAHRSVLQSMRTLARIHLPQNRKSFFTHMRFPWGKPEFRWHPDRDARCLPKRDGRDIGERSDAVLRTAMPGRDGIPDSIKVERALARASLVGD